MRYFYSKTAANQRGASSAWDFFGNTYANELKHTGAKSLQNIASGATFGLLPRAQASVNPNDRYLSDGMKTTRSVLQGIGETAGSLAGPMAAMKGLSLAHRAASGAVNTAGKAAPWYAKATKYVGDKAIGVDKWFKTPVIRAARQPGYTPGTNGGFWKELGTQMKNDSIWGNVKTLGSIGRRVGGEVILGPMTYANALASAPTVGSALKSVGPIGMGFEAVLGYNDMKDVFSRNRAGSRIQSGHLSDDQLKYLYTKGIRPEDIRLLQREYGDDWTKHPILRKAGINRDELIQELEYIA